MALNLEKQLFFYGSYHHNRVNVGIHLICVPLILMTSFLLGTNSPAVPIPSSFANPYFPANFGSIAAIAYTVLYILMEPIAGTLLAPFLLGGTAFSNYLTSTYGKTANYWALAIHISSWVAQFIGHGLFEGRAPALLDNLIQAVFLAPFFVWMEVLFFFGYRPDLKKRLDDTVGIEIARIRKAKIKSV